jgi:ribose 5-phosphate isomerase B
MKIALGCDHGGIVLKKEVAQTIEKLGHEVVDFGTHSTESCDYPTFAFSAAESVAKGDCALGVLICGTGQGIGIAANKVAGIRCGMVSETFSAEMLRKHNDANMIAIGARVIGGGMAVKIVEAFLTVEFEGDRHQRRVDMIKTYELQKG